MVVQKQCIVQIRVVLRSAYFELVPGFPVLGQVHPLDHFVLPIIVYEHDDGHRDDSHPLDVNRVCLPVRQL